MYQPAKEATLITVPWRRCCIPFSTASVQAAAPLRLMATTSPKVALSVSFQ